MAVPSGQRATLPTDVLYLLTFAAGMLAFWLSGHAGALLPVLKNHTLAVAASLTVTAAVFGAGMLLLGLAAVRRLKPTLVAVLVAVILGLIVAQVIVHLAVGRVHNKQDLGILTFVLYLCYGGIYVLSLSIGRQIARIAK